jgi:ABC-type branched-subunit amino acid transport system substrate-binding protein
MDKDSSFSSGYKLGAALEFNDPTYVRRDADDQLYQALKQGKYCYVFNSRQTGKSSLKVNLFHQLRKEGIACADIDLTTFTETETTSEQFYLDFIVELIGSLKDGEIELDVNRRVWWREHDDLSPVHRLGLFIQQVILKQISQNLVIFVDEIDRSLNLDFRSDFFALIRSFYNSRSIQSDYKRLTFVLLGVATPSDLIEDKKVTPFNIGQAIALKGFTKGEVDPLIRGLGGNVDNSSAVMTEVLYWTGGQPFLTQRLCYLIVNNSQRITAGKEKELVAQVVQSFIIDNWEEQDKPVHLEEIRDRLLKNEQRAVYLLELYRRVLQQSEIEVGKSLEEKELQLSGLVVKEGDKLRVYNPIYAAVFNELWINKQLEELRLYALLMKAWFASNCQDTSKLLRGSDLKEAIEWSKDKHLSSNDHKYLNASQQSLNNRRLKTVFFTAAGLLSGIIGSSWLWYNYIFASCPIGERVLATSYCLRSIVNSGENSRLFLGRTNVDLEEGTIKFKEKKYDDAIKRFEQAKYVDPSDPVPYIYLNNAKARLQSQLKGKPPWKLAVVVGIDSFEDTAREVLRGVADSQDKFNRVGKKDGRWLEIVIANDGNQPEFSRKVAEKLVNDQDILGIIGHQASESSETARPIYNKRNLAMLSPTSSSSELGSELKGEVFFRAIQSTAESAKVYANYIKNNLSLNNNKLRTDKLKIFYDKDKLYSNSLAKDFLNFLHDKEKKENLSSEELCRLIKRTCYDFSDSFANIKKDVLDKAKKDEVIFLIPSLNVTSLALVFVRMSNKDKNIKILVTMALSETEILTKKTDSSFEGLLLARPCVNEQSPYVKRAKKKWQQDNISWRTTSSYDATQAFVQAINSSSPQKREDMVQALKSVTLSEKESSGFGLKWSPNQSNEKRLYCMYEVYRGTLREVKVKEK